MLGEIDELGEGELLRSQVEEGIGEEGAVVGSGEQLDEKGTQVVAECLAALVEGGLDDALEQGFVAAEARGVVAGEAYDGGAHLGRRVEDMRLDGEQVLGRVPGLDEHGEDTVCLGAG